MEKKEVKKADKRELKGESTDRSSLRNIALCSGVGIITDRPGFTETYHKLLSINDNQILLVSPSEPSLAAGMIIRWIEEHSYAEHSPKQLIYFDDYLSTTTAFYNYLL